MNKEYIEREAVVNLREEFWKDRCDYMAVRVTNIMNIPAADVAPVVHGEWKNHITYVECSVCGAMPYSRSMFCPNCGAKMDGEKSIEICKNCEHYDREFTDYWGNHKCKYFNVATSDNSFCNHYEEARMDGDTKRKVGFYRDPKDHNISQRLRDGGNSNE